MEQRYYSAQADGCKKHLSAHNNIYVDFATGTGAIYTMENNALRPKNSQYCYTKEAKMIKDMK